METYGLVDLTEEVVCSLLHTVNNFRVVAHRLIYNNSFHVVTDSIKRCHFKSDV